MGLEPRTEEFASQRSFGPTYLLVFALSLLALPLARRCGGAGAFSAIAAAGLGMMESRFATVTPLSVLRRRESQNVWAVISPARGMNAGESEAGPGQSVETICLVSHMDSSRSGLMFHPSVTPYLGQLVGLAGAAVMVNALAPLLGRFLPGRRLIGGARILIAASAALVLERELCGEDVEGANDNASGVAACLNLAAHFANHPLERSRVVVLVTGSEESGVIGMRDFLAHHDTDGWLFVNFDGVSADAPLRVLSREGGATGHQADPVLLSAAEVVGRENPRLKATPLTDGSGLPYDSTVVMANGGRAMSIVNQGGAIPDYHWPTDTANRVSEKAFGRAVRFGAALLRKLDSEA